MIHPSHASEIMPRSRTSPTRSRSIKEADRPLRIAIVGAGLGGLACACALQQSCAGAGVAITVFERQSCIDDGYGGEIELRCEGPSALNELCGPSTWELLRASSNSSRPYSVPIRCVRRLLADRLHCGTIIYGAAVARQLQASVPGKNSADHTSMVHGVLADGSVTAAFDLFIDASGLAALPPPSPPHGTRATRNAGMSTTTDAYDLRISDASLAIGDARLARRGGRNTLLGLWGSIVDGVRRNRHGGDDALRDGVALGRILGECALRGRRPKDAGRFSRGCYPCLRESRGGAHLDADVERHSPRVKVWAQPTDPRVALRWVRGLLLLLSTWALIGALLGKRWEATRATPIAQFAYAIQR